MSERLFVQGEHIVGIVSGEHRGRITVLLPMVALDTLYSFSVSKLGLYQSQLERPTKYKIVVDDRRYKLHSALIETLAKHGHTMQSISTAIVDSRMPIAPREAWEGFGA
jgi:hypothetical protein